MNIYFVRHAQSEGNVSKIEHHDGVKLTEQGKKQAGSLAKRFKDIPVEVIVSSTYIRTRETAEIINEVVNKEVIYSDSLIERLVPSEILGKVADKDDVQAVYNLLRENFLKPDARHSDEENFEDLRDRAGKALDFVTSLPYENILVVTHGSFLRSLFAYMIFGKEITGREFFMVHRALRNKNTGITLVEYKKSSSPLKNDWIIHAWNDHAHLGKA